MILEEQVEGNFDKASVEYGNNPQDALDTYLAKAEFDPESNYFVVEETAFQGPFVIKLTPSAVRVEEMIGIGIARGGGPTRDGAYDVD